MRASNLAELCFVIAHQEVNAALRSIFNVRHLFTDAAVDNVLRRYAMTLQQLELRLKDICKTEETVSIDSCKPYRNIETPLDTLLSYDFCLESGMYTKKGAVVDKKT